jgi:hypothetical protein
MRVESVLNWFPDAPEHFADELYGWVEGNEECDGEAVSLADFQAWWDRLSRMAGGTMPHSLQTDVRLLFGEMALQQDVNDTGSGLDGGPVGSVACRQALLDAGLGPGGMWRVWLLADRLENAFSTAQRMVGAGADQIAVELRRSLDAILTAADRVAAETLNSQAKRVVTSVASMCSVYVEDPALTVERVRRFFDLERQYRREAGDPDPEVELTYIAFAGVTSYARLEDRDGVQHVMSLIRHRVEAAVGSLPPRFVNIWANGLSGLDPAFAQMLAQQLLHDVRTDGLVRSDDEFAAAFLLMSTSALVGDVGLADDLANEWMPLAIEAPYGPGSQQWINAFEGDSDDDE